MKVAVNARFLLKNKLEGLGWFSYEVLRRMVKNNPDVEFLFLFDRPFDEGFIFGPNAKGIVVFPQARHPFLYHWWFEYSIPKIIRREKVDVFFSPEGFIPLKLKIPTVNVIHDIVFEHYPAGVKPFNLKYFKRFFPKYANRADTIIAVSHFTKKDIVKTYGIDENKIVVALNGVGEQFRASSLEEVKDIRNKYASGSPFFLYVGALQPRKNLPGLFRAYDLFKEKFKQETKLVLVGNRNYWIKEMEAAFQKMKNKDDVVFTGRLSSDELVQLYGSALALTYVPYIEGFGLPILEGFKSQIPVITSNTSSMPEVSGDAAILVNPESHEEIADAMLQVASDEKLARRLVEKGNEQVKKFSWDNSAKVIWAEIEKIVHGTT